MVILPFRQRNRRLKKLVRVVYRRTNSRNNNNDAISRDSNGSNVPLDVALGNLYEVFAFGPEDPDCPDYDVDADKFPADGESQGKGANQRQSSHLSAHEDAVCFINEQAIYYACRDPDDSESPDRGSLKRKRKSSAAKQNHIEDAGKTKRSKSRSKNLDRKSISKKLFSETGSASSTTPPSKNRNSVDRPDQTKNVSKRTGNGNKSQESIGCRPGSRKRSGSSKRRKEHDTGRENVEYYPTYEEKFPIETDMVEVAPDADRIIDSSA